MDPSENSPNGHLINPFKYLVDGNPNLVQSKDVKTIHSGNIGLLAFDDKIKGFYCLVNFLKDSKHFKSGDTTFRALKSTLLNMNSLAFNKIRQKDTLTWLDKDNTSETMEEYKKKIKNIYKSG